jgi:GDP-L-fucose synthase
MEKTDPIFVAGAHGLVGSAVTEALTRHGYATLLTPSHAELDLMDGTAVADFYATHKPTYVIMAAARVGGIKANSTYPADFLRENLVMQDNVIWQAHLSGVKKLLFLGSSCIYPREAAQPIKEEYFMTGPLEPTNEGYAVAKIAGMKLCEKIYEQYGTPFISCMPTNIYGERDHFDPERGHVIPALMRRMHEAKMNGTSEVVVWGTGNAKREFLNARDLAEAIVFLMEHYDQKEFLNIGTGEDIAIKDLAALIKETVGYKGELVFDTTKPDGMPRKLLDVSKQRALGWSPRIEFMEGLKQAYAWYLANGAAQ